MVLGENGSFRVDISMKGGEEIVENLEQNIRCLMEFEYIWMLIVVSGKCEAKQHPVFFQRWPTTPLPPGP